MRWLCAALVAAMCASPTSATAKITERNERLCQFQHIDRAAWTPREESRTARCVVRRFGPIAGGLTKLHLVVQCESGWNRFASNAGRYLGLAQQAASMWASRVRAFQPPTWPRLPERWTNSRTQLVVTTRMVRAAGWGAWSCA